jgi:hypothetical protein
MTALELGPSTLALTFGAGLASVASPCVLPVVPIIVTGTADDHRWRPALVVAGIAASFVAMGVVTSLFGALIGPALPRLEKAVGVLVVVSGLLLLADVNALLPRVLPVERGVRRAEPLGDPGDPLFTRRGVDDGELRRGAAAVEDEDVHPVPPVSKEGIDVHRSFCAVTVWFDVWDRKPRGCTMASGMRSVAHHAPSAQGLPG